MRWRGFGSSQRRGRTYWTSMLNRGEGEHQWRICCPCADHLNLFKYNKYKNFKSTLTFVGFIFFAHIYVFIFMLQQRVKIDKNSRFVAADSWQAALSVWSAAAVQLSACRSRSRWFGSGQTGWELMDELALERYFDDSIANVSLKMDRTSPERFRDFNVTLTWFRRWYLLL